MDDKLLIPFGKALQVSKAKRNIPITLIITTENMHYGSQYSVFTGECCFINIIDWIMMMSIPYIQVYLIFISIFIINYLFQKFSFNNSYLPSHYQLHSCIHLPSSYNHLCWKVICICNVVEGLCKKRCYKYLYACIWLTSYLC